MRSPTSHWETSEVGARGSGQNNINEIFDYYIDIIFSGEMCPGNVRDMATLNEIISRKVKELTTIFTDG